MKEQLREIDRLNARLRTVRVLKGTECDILSGGELDWPERVLAGFAHHPIEAAYVVVGLGCEQMQAGMVAEAIRAHGGTAEASKSP